MYISSLQRIPFFRFSLQEWVREEYPRSSNKPLGGNKVFTLKLINHEHNEKGIVKTTEISAACCLVHSRSRKYSAV